MSTLVPPPPQPPGPPFTRWERLGLQPDTAVYVGVDDVLQLRHKSLATFTINLRVRWQRPEDGAIITQHFTAQAVPDATPRTNVFRLGEGFLLSCEATASTSGVRRGATFVELSLSRSGEGATDRAQKLFAGYLQTGQTLGYPVGDVEDPLDGQGLMLTATGANPAAGAELLVTVPANVRWRLHALRFQLVTDATVANRRVHIQFRDPVGVIFAELAAADVQAASLTRNYNCVCDGFQRAAQDNEVYLPLPVELRLMQAATVRTITTALAAGDDFGAPITYQESWLEE